MHRVALQPALSLRRQRRRWGALPATLVVFLLVLLLATTTPFGTGEGVHAGLLLHSIFPHLHLVNGRVVLHETLSTDQDTRQAAVQPATRRPGPAIGAGPGADAAEGGIGISPTLPAGGLLLPIRITRRRPPPDLQPIAGPIDAPPDPPPTSAA